MRMIGRCVVVGLVLAAAPASAMTVADFLVRAEKLSKKGMMAMFSGGEIKALKTEVQSAADAYRDDVHQAQARGDKSLGCPPEKGKAKLNANDLLKYFRAIPPERQKTISVKTGFYEMMKSRFPCS